MSPIANAKYSMLASVSQIFYLTFCILYLKVKTMSSKTAPFYPDQLHLRLECLCFLSCFYILFCFSSLPDQYLPIWRSKTFSLFCSPCCWFWLKGIGVGVGERESESIFNHKDNSFSLTRPAAPERIWHLRGLGSKNNSYLFGSWDRRDWRSKWTTGVRVSQRFGGGDLVQEKREKLSIKTGGRTRQQDSWSCFLKCCTQLPPGGLDSLEWGCGTHGDGHGCASCLSALHPISALLKLQCTLDPLWILLKCRF